MISPAMLLFARDAMDVLIDKPRQKNRQICCHKTDYRPLYECLCVTTARLTMGEKPTYKIENCGNLMHADCIEKYGKCHKHSGVRQWQSQN